jgi:hypothetical protein
MVSAPHQRLTGRLDQPTIQPTVTLTLRAGVRRPGAAHGFWSQGARVPGPPRLLAIATEFLGLLGLSVALIVGGAGALSIDALLAH